MTRRPEHPLTRATALVAALCVLMLAVFAASPTLHAGLHKHDATAAHDHAAPVGEAGHSCVVTLFAQGALALLVFCLLILARPAAAGLTLRATDELVVAQPRYRLVPSHAPPAA
jgi:hypothetical protein